MGLGTTFCGCSGKDEIKGTDVPQDEIEIAKRFLDAVHDGNPNGIISQYREPLARLLGWYHLIRSSEPKLRTFVDVSALERSGK